MIPRLFWLERAAMFRAVFCICCTAWIASVARASASCIFARALLSDGCEKEVGFEDVPGWVL